MNPIPSKLLRIILQLLLTQQPRPLQPWHPVKQHALLRIKPKLALRRASAIQRRQELLDLVLGPNDFFQIPARELQLVSEVRGDGADHFFQRDVLLHWAGEGDAYCEEVAD